MRPPDNPEGSSGHLQAVHVMGQQIEIRWSGLAFGAAWLRADGGLCYGSLNMEVHGVLTDAKDPSHRPRALSFVSHGPQHAQPGLDVKLVRPMLFASKVRRLVRLCADRRLECACSRLRWVLC